MAKTDIAVDVKKEKKAHKSQSGLNILWRELVRDKLAFASLIFIVTITIVVFTVSGILDQDQIVRVDLFSIHQPPNSQFWLGTDYGGRDVFGQLIIGTKNSLMIGFLVTFLTGIIGVTFGLVAGYFGGHVDNALMRVLDFFQILPFTMIVIVFVAIVPISSSLTCSLIMTAFLWMGIARIIRSKAMQERELDYAQASRTLETPHIKIMFGQVLPNLSSII